MKKCILLVLLVLLVTTGCTNINNNTIENIINKKTKLNYKNKVYNVYHPGYEYYMPKGLSVKNVNEMNEIITSNKYTYYLYVDLVSIYNDTQIAYEEESNLYKSLKIKYKDLTGYLKIKELNNDYLVEIMYNYAKIEVIVEESDINKTINNCMTILSTIKYNKSIIENLMQDNLLNYKDETLDLFDKVTKEDNFIKYEQDYDDYESKIPDFDIIN